MKQNAQIRNYIPQLSFPSYYRQEEIEFIATMLTRKQSGVVVGGSGSGKSNIARILAYMLNMILHLLPTENQYLFCLVDLNKFASDNPIDFYRGMLYELYKVAERAGLSVAEDIRQLEVDTRQWADRFSWFIALERAHQLIINHENHHLIWLLDRFDKACPFLDDNTLDNLRSLRDDPLFNERVFYIAFSRQPLQRLRSWGRNSELIEILESNTCWVGPMVERDARWNVQQIANHEGEEISSSIETAIVKLTGGLPAFTKAASELWLKESEDIRQTVSEQDKGDSKIINLIGSELSKRLLQQNTVRRTCQEIVDDLEENERRTLKYVASGMQQIGLDPNAINYLANQGLIKWQEYIDEVTRNVEKKWRVFSSLFEIYVKGVGDRDITVDDRRRKLLLDLIPMNINLAKQPYELAAYMIERPSQAIADDEIIELLWPEDKTLPDPPSRKSSIDAALGAIRKALNKFSEENQIEPSLEDRFYTKSGHRFYEPNQRE